jgi:hypothetical protein
MTRQIFFIAPLPFSYANGIGSQAYLNSQRRNFPASESSLFKEFMPAN